MTKPGRTAVLGPGVRRRAATTAAGVAAVGALLTTLALPSAASAYVRPPGGAWTVQHMFDSTSAGKLALSRRGTAVSRLSLTPGSRSTAECGTSPVALVGSAPIKSYRKVNGRYAVATLPGQLFKPTRVRFRRNGQTIKGTLLLLWDHNGRLMDTGRVELADGCLLQFTARKR